MAGPMLNFGEALTQVLQSEQCLVDLTTHSQPSVIYGPTVPTINIGESSPETQCELPFIGWEIMDSSPLLADLDKSGWYRTMVWVWSASHDKLKTRQLADAVQCFFDTRPVKNQKWFRDITNDCILNKCSIFRNRINFQRDGINKYKFGKDAWLEVCEVQFIWRNCPCSDVRCPDTVIEDCPADDTGNFDPNCQC